MRKFILHNTPAVLPRLHSASIRNCALVAAYARKAQAEGFLPDACQAACLERLAKVRSALVKGGTPRGLYIYGGVGTGKTMLMDLFHEELTSEGVSCERQHFHEFLQAVHRRLHKLRLRVGSQVNLLGRCAEEYFKEFPVLAFDEAHVLNVGDALMLRSFFEAYFKAGGVVIATSNVAPDDLYASGINREVFLPFLDALRERCDFHLMKGRHDYRVQALGAGRLRGAYMMEGCDIRGGILNLNDFPAMRTVLALPAEASASAQSVNIDVGFARTFRCNNAWSFKAGSPLEAEKKVLHFDFDELCRTATGPSEWVGLASFADAIIVTDVPQFATHDEDAARRFITFVDIVYDKQKFLVVTAAVSPGDIFKDLIQKYGGDDWKMPAIDYAIDQRVADAAPIDPLVEPKMKMPAHGLGSGRHGVVFQKPKALHYGASGAYQAIPMGFEGDLNIVPKAVSSTRTGGRAEHGFGSQERVMKGLVEEDSDWVEWSATGLKDASLFDLSPVNTDKQIIDKLLPFHRCASRLHQMHSRSE